MVLEAPAAATAFDRETPATLRAHLDECEKGHRNCVHCLFAAGYLGRLRKGAKALQSESKEHSWKQRCTFSLGEKRHTWIVALRNPFQIGCWACHSASNNSAFARLEVKNKGAMQITNLLWHEVQKGHQQAVKKLNEVMVPAAGAVEEEAEVGTFSGPGLAVPRADKWAAALNVLIERAGYEAHAARVQTQSLGSCLAPGGDTSTRVVKQMYECLRSPLDAMDIKRIREAVACSLAIDKGDGHLVVYGRLLGHYGLYDFFVGVGDAGATPEAPDCGQAILDCLVAILKILGKSWHLSFFKTPVF